MDDDEKYWTIGEQTLECADKKSERVREVAEKTVQNKQKIENTLIEVAKLYIKHLFVEAQQSGEGKVKIYRVDSPKAEEMSVIDVVISLLLEDQNDDFLEWLYQQDLQVRRRATCFLIFPEVVIYYQ